MNVLELVKVSGGEFDGFRVGVEGMELDGRPPSFDGGAQFGFKAGDVFDVTWGNGYSEKRDFAGDVEALSARGSDDGVVD